MIHSFIAEQTQANLNFQIELQKDKRVYCFIGENGAGKTQLLETMAKSFLYCHSLLKKGGQYYNMFYLRDGIYEFIKSLTLHLAQGITINAIKCKDKVNQAWNMGLFEHLLVFPKPIEFYNPIVYIGARNRGYAKNLDKNNVKVIGNRNDRFIASFMKTFNYFNGDPISDEAAVDWFISRLIVNPKYVYGLNLAEDQIILLCKLLQELEPVKLKDLIINNNSENEFELGFFEGKLYFNEIPFEKLSTGYISIIKIFQDIVDGFSAWRLDDTEDISQMEGIVFIDEIEAHLHPKWEQNIIPLLKKHFPKATFYVATHSPIVIASTDEGEAYELIRDDENNITARELGNPKAWYMADIYSQAFHVVQSQDAKDEQVELITLTAKYSALVKDYVKSKNEAKKQEIEIVFEQLDKAMATTDPRRITLENLKTLVQ